MNKNTFTLPLCIFALTASTIPFSHAEEDPIERVQITGSHIKRMDME